MAVFAISRATCVLLFLVLLIIQLTGLSCLNEWSIEPQNIYSQGTTGIADDCPCHFTFVSSPSTIVHRSSRVTRVTTCPPFTYSLTHLFSCSVLLPWHSSLPRNEK